MLDNILNRVRRGAERVQRRGEEVTQSARLRLEVFQLNRELDGLYARLGRSYHAGADLEVLQGIRDDIRRVDEEISARERLIQELGSDAGDHEAPSAPAAVVLTEVYATSDHPATTSTPPARTEPNVPAAVPPPQETTMTDRDTDRPLPTSPNPTVEYSDDLLVPGKATDEQGDDLGRESREKSYTHRNQIDEGREASQNPDPLDM
ncbi:hypothetical protein [Deinococcus metallilatus]|uniref:Uncharacterized protein n=1 Tax=Deinococcus metallilatus TaxID=1211322 RepID=A0ABR6MYG9_9DEIO|nr:hypothetical protein [Deinococcus metallilatus]MBB5296990.1 hypothetical protein [Deinococcus metallilatus]GMA15956.1 hypothetical protein GCM10025871_22870 [Deinococcus metallilatus]